MDSVIFILFTMAIVGALLLLFMKIFVRLPLDFQKFLLDLWAYKEIRLMLTLCLVLYFASIVFPNLNSHQLVPNKIEFAHNVKMELSGKNSYTPIEVEVKNK